MFAECKNLKYLNFKGNSKADYESMFANTPENMVACFPDDSENESLRTLFAEKTCEVIDCSGNWETKQKKINGETGDCMDSCSGDFLYEYNTKCYRKCPKGTKVIENQYLCEETTIEEEIINTTNEVLETNELSYEKEEQNNEIETNEEIEEEEINQSENNNQELNEKEKMKISDIVTDINTYENEKVTNTVEINEEEINKDSNKNNQNEDYKDIKVAVISIRVSICVVIIVSTLVIIKKIYYFSLKLIILA